MSKRGGLSTWIACSFYISQNSKSWIAGWIANKLQTFLRSRFHEIYMMRRAKISTNVLARLSKGESVSMDSMEKICKVLDCNIGDVMEFIPEEGGPEHDS